MSDRSETHDDQFEAEATDSDEIDVLDFPPERSLGVEELLDNDVTAAGEYAPDTLRRRQGRLRPDAARSDDLRITTVAPGGVTDPDDQFGFDERQQLVGERGAADWAVIDPGMVLADSSAVDHLGVEGWPAEEAALHLEETADPADDETDGIDGSGESTRFGNARAGSIDDQRGPLR